MALFKDASGQLVVAAAMPVGGSVVSAAASSNLSDLAPWYRALDANNTDWHPANYYDGGAESSSVNSVLPYLSKPVIILQADAAGTVGSYANASGTFNITVGGVDVSATATFSIAAVVGVTASIDVDGIYTVTGLSIDSGSVDLTATYQGISYTFTLSVIKNRAGAGASTSTIYFINTSAPVITKQAPDAASVGIHSNVTVLGRKVDGATITDNTGFWLTVTPNGGTEAATATASPVVIAPVSSDGKTFYTVRLYNGATVSSATLLDTEVIPVVFSGAQGAAGIDGMTFVLTNDNHTVPTLPDGSSGNFSNSGTDIYVYEGATQLAYDGVGSSIGTWTVSAVGSGITPGILTDQGAFARISASTSMPSDIAYVSFNITGRRLNGSTFTVNQWQTVNKAKQGVSGSGSNSRSVSLYTPNQAFVYTQAGVSPVPTTATVTATPLNTIGTVYYEFSVDGTVVQNTTSNSINYTAKTNFVDMPDQIVVNIREGAGTGSVLASDVMTLFGLKPGADGVNGSRTCVLDMYQWASSAPTTFPSGSSTYTWANGTFTAPATPNGWSLTPPAGSAGQTLYIVRQPYGDNLTSATSIITWAATFAVPTGQAGLSGVNGQRVGVLELYQWSIVQPPLTPSGSSTYTWSDGTFTLPTTANGWSLLPGASTPGSTLWGTMTTISNTSTSPTDTVTWSASPVYTVGASGNDGLTLILSNETHTCPADAAGNVTSYVNSETEVWLYDGATAIQYDGLGTTNNTFKVTAFGTDIIPGAITDQGAQAKVANASGFTQNVDVAKIAFTITGKRSNGQAFSFPKYQTFSKSRQGATGSNGLNGARGSGTFYTAGSVWSDTTANNKVLSLYSSLVYGDQVTISNGLTYAMTKYWDGVSWTAPGQVIDGNLLVSGSVSAAQINSNGLTIRDVNGNVLFGAGTSLDYDLVGGTKPPSNATYGADASNLSVGVGGNVLNNSNFVGGIAGWGLVGAGTLYHDMLGYSWQPLNGHSIGIARSGMPFSTSTAFGPKSALLPNTRYELSAFLASHWCLSSVGITILRADQVTSDAHHVFNRSSSTANGGQEIGKWERVGGFFTTTSQAAFFYIEFNVGYPTAPDPFAWMTNVKLAIAHAGQTQLSAYSVGGSGGVFSELNQINAANVGVYMALASIDTLRVAGGAITAVNVDEANSVTVPIPFPADVAYGSELIVNSEFLPIVDMLTDRVISVSFTLAHGCPTTGRLWVRLYRDSTQVAGTSFNAASKFIMGSSIEAYSFNFLMPVPANASVLATVKVQLMNGIGSGEYWSGTNPTILISRMIIQTSKR